MFVRKESLLERVGVFMEMPATHTTGEDDDEQMNFGIIHTR